MGTKIHRVKRNFTAGELSPVLSSRKDNDRYKNGCNILLNAYAKTQGPAMARSGFEFIYDLTPLLESTGLTNVNPRTIPFIFSRNQAYVLVFFKHNSGKTRVVFATHGGLVEDSTDPGNPYIFEFDSPMDIQNMRYAQSADILFLAQPDLSPIEFKRYDDDNWEANTISFRDIPYTLNKEVGWTFTPSGTTGAITVTSSRDAFDASWIGTSIKIGSGIMNVDSLDITHPATIVHCTTSVNLAGTTATDQWYTQAWSPVNGFPSNVAFFEQRIVYAATDQRPQAMWFSKSGDYYDFGVTSPTIVDSDACTFTLDSGQQNRIAWLCSARQLIVGTIGDEWSVSGANYAPLSFESIRNTRQTNIGSDLINPLMIGPAILFVETLGRTVNQFVYDYATDSYDSVDLSILAPHLTENYSITHWEYQQTPSGIVWAVREDGVLLGLTFKREHNVTGWHRHITQGSFLDVACIPGERENDLYAVIKRIIDGDDKWYIERKAPEFLADSDMEDSRFLDSYLEYDGEPEDTLTGFDHLEGKTVSILADGSVHPDRVVTAGSITLNKQYSKVVVGLGYEVRIEPCLLDVPDGTIEGRVQKMLEIDINILNSGPFEFGTRNEETGEEIFDYVVVRKEWDQPAKHEPLFTGIKHKKIPTNWGRQPRLIFRQTKPLPLNILSFVDHIMVED